MSYENHLRAVLAEFFRVRPSVSHRELSRRAGLSAGWVSDFLRTGTASLSKADAILDTVYLLAPEGDEGAALITMIKAVAAPRTAASVLSAAE